MTNRLLPGQKKQPPDYTDSIRIFYESLYNEKGLDSIMATKWMLLHGLLPEPLALSLTEEKEWNCTRCRGCAKPKFRFLPIPQTKKPTFRFKPIARK